MIAELQGMKKKLRLATILAASLAIAPIAALSAVAAPASATVLTSAATTLQPGSSYLNPASGSWTDGTATVSTTVAALPASGGGLYTGVRIRESAAGYYLVHSRVYPDGDIQSSIRRVNIVDGTSTTTVLSETKSAPVKAAAGSALAITLQSSGTDDVNLRAKVTVGGGAPLELTATDTSSASLGGGTAASWGYLSASTPAIPVAKATVESLPATETPTTNPAPAPGEHPSAATTGVPEGTQLKRHDGDLTVTTPGAVIDGLEIHGLVIVNAPDVVIKNSRILGRSVDFSAGLVSNVRSGQPFTIQDSEITAAVPSPYLNGIFGSAFTALRVDISNVIDPIHVIGGDVEIRDSWLHDNDHYEQDPLWNGTPSHSDSLQIEAGRNITVVGNRMEHAHNAAIQITQNTSKAQLGDLRITDNYFDDGGCTVNIARTPAPISNFVVANNEFGPDRGFAGCGILAPSMNTPQQSGNVWEATGKAVVQTLLK